MKNATLRQLKVFEAVARHRSFSRAAEELHLTQPAVSTQVAKLEEHAGLPLFEQLGKKIHLTAAGQQMLQSSREIIQKFQGRLWSTTLDHSPFDVVAWHGNLAPCRYDLRRFNTINTVSFDHPDPSIFTVLTSPSEIQGTANCDFVIFPPRWMVAEDTFRPPWFHRNVMSEYMGLIEGAYDAKEGGFEPGGASLHNQMAGHGPDRASYEKAISAELGPQKIAGTMAFMFESRRVIRPTRWAAETPLCQVDYDECWTGFAKARLP